MLVSAVSRTLRDVIVSSSALTAIIIEIAAKGTMFVGLKSSDI